MKAAQAIYNIARVGLGATHLGLQTLADGVLNLEGEVVKRTGYWEGDKQVMLDDNNIRRYKVARRNHTKAVQKKGKAKLEDIRSMLAAKKEQTVFTKVA